MVDAINEKDKLKLSQAPKHIQNTSNPLINVKKQSKVSSTSNNNNNNKNNINGSQTQTRLLVKGSNNINKEKEVILRFYVFIKKTSVFCCTSKTNVKVECSKTEINLISYKEENDTIKDERIFLTIPTKDFINVAICQQTLMQKNSFNIFYYKRNESIKVNEDKGKSLNSDSKNEKNNDNENNEEMNLIYDCNREIRNVRLFTDNKWECDRYCTRLKDLYIKSRNDGHIIRIKLQEDSETNSRNKYNSEGLLKLKTQEQRLKNCFSLNPKVIYVKSSLVEKLLIKLYKKKLVFSLFYIKNPNIVDTMELNIVDIEVFSRISSNVKCTCPLEKKLSKAECLKDFKDSDFKSRSKENEDCQSNNISGIYNVKEYVKDNCINKESNLNVVKTESNNKKVEFDCKRDKIYLDNEEDNNNSNDKEENIVDDNSDNNLKCLESGLNYNKHIHNSINDKEVDINTIVLDVDARETNNNIQDNIKNNFESENTEKTVKLYIFILLNEINYYNFLYIIIYYKKTQKYK